MSLRKTCIALAASSCLCTASSALEVVWDERTPADSRVWADNSRIRERMETLGAKICKALYGNTAKSHLHENFRITLYLAPVKGGNPAFASGKRITWKVGEHPSGDGSGGTGLLCHEMTHVLDMSTDRVFTEGMADWTRNYMVRYERCSNPAYVSNLRWKALRGGRKYGKYLSGANFIDFMTQTYGEGTILRIMEGYKKDGKDHWEKTFGKNFDALLEEWKNMQTIYDPLYMWSYDGSEKGVFREDKGWCKTGRPSVKDAGDGSGAWIAGATCGAIARDCGGSCAIALHGRFPRPLAPLAIASLGSPNKGPGKGAMLVLTPKADTIQAIVVASVPGKPCSAVSVREIHVPDLATKPHSFVLSVHKNDTVIVSVDGDGAARLDMAGKCAGCTFSPSFGIGGFSGGGAPGVNEPNGAGGILIDDVRVFQRAFRKKETKLYADVFGPSYRPAVAVDAEWTGEPGGDPSDPSGWLCINSAGERIKALPGPDTEVRVWGWKLPSIPKGSEFRCKSFTIDGWAEAKDADIDLRGVRIVTLSDNARVMTSNGKTIAVSCLKAPRMRLGGSLAVTTGLNVGGTLEIGGGSRLKLPANPAHARAGSLKLTGEGAIELVPGEAVRAGNSANVLCCANLPDDLSRLRLGGCNPEDAYFKTSTDKKHLGVHRVK